MTTNERIIKFNFWHKDLKKMVTWEEAMAPAYNTGKDHAIYYLLHSKSWHIPLQYLEHNDSYGTELYDGDVVEVNYEDKSEPTGAGIYYLLLGFEKGAAGWYGDNTDNFHPLQQDPPCSLDTWKKIGNIYENPELIKKCKNPFCII